MICRHCGINFHDSWDRIRFSTNPNIPAVGYVDFTICPACKKEIVKISIVRTNQRFIAYPTSTSRKPLSDDIPETLRNDYTEAALVLPISPKASATLSRRCLQIILHSQGYKAKDLAKEIDLLLNEKEPLKAISSSLRMTVDLIRNFGNFSAHPIKDLQTLEIIDVEEGEAEYCLDVLDAIFDHYYVKPAEALRLKDSLNQKLTKAGKPPAK